MNNRMGQVLLYRGGYISKHFVCQNERIWTLGGRAPGTPPRSAYVCSVLLFLVFRYERPILGDDLKLHKFACSGRLPYSVTEEA